MKSSVYLIAALAIAASAACAPTQVAENTGAPEGRDCFYNGMVNGFTAVDKDTVRLSAGPTRDYDVDLQGPLCDNITWTNSIAVVSRPSSWICVGEQVGQGDVVFRDSSWPSPISCMITAVRRVPEAPAAAPPA